MPIINKVLQVPAIGRMVHFRSAPDECNVAFITHVDKPGDPFSSVALVVFGVRSMHQAPHVHMGEGAGYWHWPEFVPGVPDPSVPSVKA